MISTSMAYFMPKSRYFKDSFMTSCKYNLNGIIYLQLQVKCIVDHTIAGKYCCYCLYFYYKKYFHTFIGVCFYFGLPYLPIDVTLTGATTSVSRWTWDQQYLTGCYTLLKTSNLLIRGFSSICSFLAI